MLALLLGSVSLALGQVLVVIPQKAEVPLGGTQKFEAQAFTRTGEVIRLRGIHWAVKPDSLGTITDDGFFIAGHQPGEGKIIAVAQIDGQTLRGEAEVYVGKRPVPRIRVVVIPKEAVVPPGDSLQFRARVVDPVGAIIPNLRVRWRVQPDWLGHIDQTGLFRAGGQLGDGWVIASVEFLGQVYRGKAHVIVGPRPSSQINGVVMDEDLGTPVEGARVMAFRVYPPFWVRAARSDSTGAYHINNLIPGVYVVRAQAPNLVPEYYDDARFLEEATPIQVAEHDTITGIDFALSHGGAITGQVTEEVTDTPIQGAHVVAELVVNTNIRYHALSQEDGTYRMEGIPEGYYYVYAKKPGYAKEYYNNVPTREEATMIQVQEDQVVENIDFTLQPRSAITGTVINEKDGTPIAGAVVTARLLSGSSQDKRRTLTNAEGKYILPVPPGWYVVWADARGFVREYYDNADDPEEATPVEVLENQHTSGIDFSLLPLATISGQVVDETTGEPIPRAPVWAFPEIPFGRPYWTFTDSTGHYILTNIRPGIYFLKATARDYLPEFYQESPDRRHATPIAVRAGDEITDINFTLLKGGVISGTVTSELTTEPIPKAVVIAKRINDHFLKATFSDSLGNYRLTGLPGGSYIVMAKARGYHREYYDNVPSEDQATPVEVTPPEEVTNINFTLAPITQPGGGIAGTVISEGTGEPIAGAWIIVVPVRMGAPRFGFTGPDGMYRILGLRTGRYYVLAWAPGFIGEFYDDAHNWRDADPVAVEAPQITEGIDFALTPQRPGIYAIRGRVLTHSTSSPASQVAVYARETGSGEFAGFALSDSDGRFEISDLPPGNYRVFALRPGYSATEASWGASDTLEVKLGDGEDAEGVSLQLNPVITGVSDPGTEGAVPNSFGLFQNAPNPFNPETVVRFQVPVRSHVELRVYNLLGQEIRTLVDEIKAPGVHQVVWNGRDNQGQPVASGVYFLQMKAATPEKSTFVALRKMVLAR